MVKYILCFLFAFFATALLAFGEDTSNRERKVRVALALQSATETAVVESAPEPKTKQWPSFAEGYSQAVATDSVLVVYIGCEGSHPISAISGCVVATQKELPTYGKGTILIAYPIGKQLLEHKTLKCEEYLVVAVEATKAQKKLDKAADGDKPIAKPLDWNMVKADCCSYCTGECKCANKENCKNSNCLVAKPEVKLCSKCKECECECKKEATPKVETKSTNTGVVTQPAQLQGYTLYQNVDGTYFYMLNSNCPGGNCPKR